MTAHASASAQAGRPTEVAPPTSPRRDHPAEATLPRPPVLQSGCLLEILGQYAPLTPEELLVGGALPQSVLDKLAHYDNPAQSAPSAPILLVQGTLDEAVPYEVTAGPLLTELSAYRQPVQFAAIEGANHDGAVFGSVTLVADWIATRFAG